MKKLILVPAFIVLTSLLSCDKVKLPIEKTDTAVGTSFITKSNATRSNFRKVLLEDYTGHQCGNCPAAAIVAENLSNTYKDSLVVIAVHAGFFTKLNAPEFLTSYTCQAGNDWDGAATGFGISSAGNPNGMVNRKNFPSDGLIQKETKWPTTVPIALRQQPFIVKLDVTTKYDSTARALNTEIKAKFKTNYTNTTKLCVVFIEDKIVGAQKDYTKNPDVIEEYDFEHMLRGSINGSWGADLKTGPINVNDSVALSYPNFSLPTSINTKSAVNDKNVAVVVFAYDAITREILQVEKVKIR